MITKSYHKSCGICALSELLPLLATLMSPEHILLWFSTTGVSVPLIKKMMSLHRSWQHHLDKATGANSQEGRPLGTRASGWVSSPSQSCPMFWVCLGCYLGDLDSYFFYETQSFICKVAEITTFPSWRKIRGRLVTVVDKTHKHIKMKKKNMAFTCWTICQSHFNGFCLFVSEYWQ